MSEEKKIREYVNVLRRADMFYDLSHAHLEMMAGICSEAEYELGDIIFEENSTGRELYVIAAGEVEIQLDPSMIRPGGRSGQEDKTTIATLRAGQTFGEIALVDEGLRTASARAASRRTRLLILPCDEVIDLSSAHPDLGFRLMRNVAADLAFKIRGTDLMIREQLLWKPRSVKL
ncbi:MAG: cyclic nucleotide-binding domain-containing protein [Anaerolineae bacterium]|jgi:CRP-like cAMP-binding protein